MIILSKNEKYILPSDKKTVKFIYTNVVNFKDHIVNIACKPNTLLIIHAMYLLIFY